MSKQIQAIRGMNDCLPTESGLWQYVESTIRQVVASYGYQEIRTPIVESTDLFKRSIGEVTDIVEKEMYTFEDRNSDSLSLRQKVLPVWFVLEMNMAYYTTNSSASGIWAKCSAMNVHKRDVQAVPSIRRRSIWFSWTRYRC